MAGPRTSRQHVSMLEQFHRPLICTEYMARGAGSTFDTVLPIARQHRVGAINWGLVAGKSQTYLPGSPGSIRTLKISPQSGFTTSFTPTASLTARRSGFDPAANDQAALNPIVLRRRMRFGP